MTPGSTYFIQVNFYLVEEYVKAILFLNVLYLMRLLNTIPFRSDGVLTIDLKVKNLAILSSHEFFFFLKSIIA